MFNPMLLSNSPIVVRLDPQKFYAVAGIIRTLGQDHKFTLTGLDDMATALDSKCLQLEDEIYALSRAQDAISVEERRSKRRRTLFEQDKEDPLEDLRNVANGQNFIQVIFDVIATMQIGFRKIHELARGIRPDPIMVSRGGGLGASLADLDFDKMQRVMLEMSMNSNAVERFLDGVLNAESASELVVSIGSMLVQKLDHYHRMLLHRHSVEGVQIHGDPITTDIAITIYENVDASGEIQDGKDPNEISAYSAHKAEIVAGSVKNGMIGGFVSEPQKIFEFIKQNLVELQAIAVTLGILAAPVAVKLREVLGPSIKKSRKIDSREFDHALSFLDVLDPLTITFKEKTGMLSAEERFALNFKNETISEIVHRLKDTDYPVEHIIQYVLRRKAELRDYYRDENSFYVCKVGSGNPFLGVAPGELEVIPGTRPVINLNEVVGSGFEEIKGFLGQVEATGKWYELFLATSPSRTTSKSNVLMVGPMGCGKSEVLRAVGGDKKSIGIFAVGSDFLTCWKGEAEKNPKRLFESANKLQKESKKHVHILIDEIDTILNDGRGHESFGGANLTTEFQNLMDGVVHYPNLSVWGATNNVERIPMPMIRRFSKVLVVGELDARDRVKLLKHFSSFMPAGSIEGSEWDTLAKKLDGATGDVIRKVIDYVWREKMTAFVDGHKKEAETVLDYLKKSQNQKFTLAAFTGRQKEALHELLKPFVRVRFEDLDKSVDLHLENVAVHAEIETARATYARAKAFLMQIKKTAAPSEK